MVQLFILYFFVGLASGLVQMISGVSVLSQRMSSEHLARVQKAPFIAVMCFEHIFGNTFHILCVKAVSLCRCRLTPGLNVTLLNITKAVLNRKKTCLANDIA